VGETQTQPATHVHKLRSNQLKYPIKMKKHIYLYQRYHISM
jgi:hypothetical protein